MGRLGIGAMLHQLGGGSENGADKYYGRKIVAAKMDVSPEDYNSCGDRDRGALLISFEDGVTIKIWDNGQSCCEHRYITTDDNPADLVGHPLVAIECRPAPEPPKKDEYDQDHEAVFIDIKTDQGVGVTLCCHNEHNGYYGGFGLTITEEKGG